MPGNEKLAPDADAYFDAVVAPGDWAKLRGLLECPQQFEIAALVEGLPKSFFEVLDCPIQDLEAGDLPVPQEALAHLTECNACREAFDNAFAARLRLRRMLLCPGVKRLAAYAKRAKDEKITQHLATCAPCGAELALLGESLAPVWLILPLKAAVAKSQMGERLERALGNLVDTLSGQRARLREVVGALATMVDACVQTYEMRPIPVGLGTRGLKLSDLGLEPAPSERGQDAPSYQLSGLLLNGDDRDITIGWDVNKETVSIGPLHGDGGSLIEQFRLEIRRSGEVVWPSPGADYPAGTSSDCVIRLPMAVLEEAIANGADELAIVIAQGK